MKPRKEAAMGEDLALRSHLSASVFNSWSGMAYSPNALTLTWGGAGTSSPSVW